MRMRIGPNTNCSGAVEDTYSRFVLSQISPFWDRAAAFDLIITSCLAQTFLKKDVKELTVRDSGFLVVWFKNTHPETRQSMLSHQKRYIKGINPFELIFGCSLLLLPIWISVVSGATSASLLKICATVCVCVLIIDGCWETVVFAYSRICVRLLACVQVT